MSILPPIRASEGGVGISVKVLRECFRQIPALRVLWEEQGIDVIRAADGTEVCLWDVLWLIDRVDDLAPRQAMAVRLMLLEDRPEAEVAALMGTTPKNPVGTYATDGLKRLVVLYEERLRT